MKAKILHLQKDLELKLLHRINPKGATLNLLHVLIKILMSNKMSKIPLSMHNREKSMDDTSIS